MLIPTPSNLDMILYATELLMESSGLLATHVLMRSDAGVTLSVVAAEIL